MTHTKITFFHLCIISQNGICSKFSKSDCFTNAFVLKFSDPDYFDCSMIRTTFVKLILKRIFVLYHIVLEISRR